ncbi:MAG TPA: alpha/beta fold hydrolase [Mucilaginibacter sp.]|nr:alpha/beta fold hydrolase [Mucilaginibacter sp.]
MKKLIVGVVTLLFFNQVKAQDLEGSWQGVINAGGVDLHLVFNIKKTSDTSYTSTFDSPDQKAFGIACSKTYKVKDSVFIEMAIINGGYKGLWDGKDGITGIYRQNGGKISLNMKRLTDADKAQMTKTPERPQTPKPPYNYFSEDVEYDNADKSLHYGATFTRPNGDGKYPAVIIITGSGTQDRDGTIFGHKLYWVLADYLTKNGIAVLRVDDRGAGKSSLGRNISKATSADFSYDVEASLNYLETRTDVNKKHLGLIGHSEGGIIAPMVAARRKDISFIVLWGASAVGGAKINAEQNAYALRKNGIDSTAVNAFINLHRQALALFASSVNMDALNQKIMPVWEAWKKDQPKKIQDALYVHDFSILGQDVFTIYDGLYNLPWMRYFIAYDPATDLSKVKCSVLAINGSKDTQVDAKSNLARIKEILTKSGNKDFETEELPGLNHLLQTATTGDLSEYEKISETISPDAMKIISEWIKIHTK